MMCSIFPCPSFSVMDRNQHVVANTGTGHQFEFHEFVPGPSSQCNRLNTTENMSACVLRPLFGDCISISKLCHQSSEAVPSTMHPFPVQSLLDMRSSSTKVNTHTYEPPPSGPLVVSGSNSISGVATLSDSPGTRFSAISKPAEAMSTAEHSSFSISPCKSVCQYSTEATLLKCEAGDRSIGEKLLGVKGGDTYVEKTGGALSAGPCNLLSVDTKVASNDHSAGSFSECGVCGPEKAIWVPNISETGEPLVESTSGHGQTIKIDPVDTFWIQCDCCEKWFHGNCVGVEEYEDALIDKFHCSQCSITSGPTKMRDIILRHRFAFDDLSQSDLPPEIGTESWIKMFIETEANIPPLCEDQATVFENGFDFMEHFKRKEEWRKIYLIRIARGLELRVPEKEDNFGLHSIVEIFGRSYKVDTIDVYRQVTHSMSIGAFYDKMTVKDRPRLYNILSLEFSQNEAMRKMVSPPLLVLELSFVHKLWPDRSDVINWDPELDYLPSTMKVRQIVEVFEEHRRNKPEVALFCLCGMAGSYTDFHIDFGGSSVWYHIYQGKKIFYVVEPTEEYLNLFENYQRCENKTEVFFGDLLPSGALRRLVINEGETLMIPSGWIHAVYTPVDSLVFGGNFLHALNAPMQLRIYEMEQRLKKEIGTEDKFLFPHFELVNWYAARSFILEHLREANDEGSRVDQYIMDAALALLPRLKDWLRRDKEENSNITHSSFGDLLAKLQKEINKQERVRRSLSPGSRSPKKRSKKRKSEEHDSFIEENRSCSFDGISCPCKVATEISSPPLLAGYETLESKPTTSSKLDPLETDSDIPVDFRIKLTKKGKSYASSVVEKPDPMLEDVNMTQMFARRSSSGRQPRPAAWLAAAVGLDELEKTSKRLEESGEQYALREPISYDAEMERACKEEEAELLREENRRKRKDKFGTAKKSIQIRTVTRKKLTTAKQRLAAKLKLK